MNKVWRLVFLFLTLGLFTYNLLPSPSFPLPPPDALQSREPADSETLLRRAYFTNLTREEVMEWYLDQFKWGYRLNYGPEESPSIIRDQTRSTFLEEIVHPFRESIFINGFEPKVEKDKINIEGRPWRQKIIVRHIPSNAPSRLVVSALTIVMILILVREYSYILKRK